MLLGWKAVPLVLKHLQRLNDLGAGLGGIDDVVYETAAGGDIRVAEPVAILLGQLVPGLLLVLRLPDDVPIRGTSSGRASGMSSGVRVRTRSMRSGWLSRDGRAR